MSDKISVSREELRVFFWAVIDSCAAEHYGSEIEEFDRKLNGCIDKLFTPSPSAAVCEMNNIANLLKTQDNRITKDPMFCVQESVIEYGFDQGYGDDGHIWFDDEQSETVPGARASRLDALIDNFESPPNRYRQVFYKKRWEFVTACFTEQGCNDYIKSCKHRHSGRLRIYAYSAYGNAEFKSIRKHLMDAHCGLAVVVKTEGANDDS